MKKRITRKDETILSTKKSKGKNELLSKLSKTKSNKKSPTPKLKKQSSLKKNCKTNASVKTTSAITESRSEQYFNSYRNPNNLICIAGMNGVFNKIDHVFKYLPACSEAEPTEKPFSHTLIIRNISMLT